MDLGLNKDFSHTTSVLKSPSSSLLLICLHSYVDGYKSKRLGVCLFVCNSLQTEERVLLWSYRGDVESGEGKKGKHQN